MEEKQEEKEANPNYRVDNPEDPINDMIESCEEKYQYMQTFITNMFYGLPNN